MTERACRFEITEWNFKLCVTHDSPFRADICDLGLAALRAQLEAAHNLLAVLHGDGGHHTESVGFLQSCLDAGQVRNALCERLDEQARAHTQCIVELQADELATANRENELHDAKDKKLEEQAKEIAGLKGLLGQGRFIHFHKETPEEVSSTDLEAWDRLRKEMTEKGFLLMYVICLDGDEVRKALSPKEA